MILEIRHNSYINYKSKIKPDLQKLGFVIITLLILTPISTQVWAAYDSSHLRVPNFTISPISGPPGTEVTIKVSNLPDVSDEPYPYPDFYVYLPFADAIGSNVPGQCDGETCFPIYTYEDAKRGNFADKTITFALFSVNNPKPILLSGLPRSVCDITVNQKIQQSYTDICNTKNQPPGTYEIKFAWGTITGQYDVVKTLVFTVTEGEEASEPIPQRFDQILIKQYQDGVINEAQFEKGLKDQGYTDEEIRQTKAVMGKLPHQLAGQAQEQKEAIEKGIEKTKEAAQEKTEPTTKPKSGCLIATAAFGSELAPQVQMLRETRDNIVMQTKSGAAFMTAFNSVYYSFAPTVADWEQQNPAFKEIVKTAITPLITTLSILNHVDIDSETEMISYGIGVILLNIGMYLVAPAFVIVKLSRKVRN